MKKYDVIVIGAGVGTSLAFKALSSGFKTALVEKGTVGGTCINVGCVPSKMLIYPADRVAEIREAKKLGIDADIRAIDFPAIMERMRAAVSEGREWIKGEIENSRDLDFYGAAARFIGDYTLDAGGETIRGRKIFIVSGARPLIPPIRGLENVDYLTNENVLDLKEKPASMIVVGGGYVGVEYAHFLSSLGTAVTLVQRADRLLPNEEPEISELLRKELAKRMEVLIATETVEVSQADGGYRASVKNLATGEIRDVAAEKILVAAGRVSNADQLDVGKTGVETDAAGYIKVDDALQTGKRNIWALGDAIGKQMFTHAGDMEQRVAWHNSVSRKKIRIDFNGIPHAVFTWPQIASVGLTEAEAARTHDILVGRAHYSDVVMGSAMMEVESFVKAVVEKGTEKILGFHIIGPGAAVLIQEVVNVMARGGGARSITDNLHIFPALSEVVPEALNNLSEPGKG